MSEANQVGSPSALQSASGILLGRFRPVRRISRGAFGEVFEAFDLQENTTCAVKCVGAVDPIAVHQLADEFARLVPLRHPGLVRIRASGVDGDAKCACLAMDLVGGQNLHDVLRGRSGEERLSAFTTLARRLADVIAYLHRKGILHRDISPSNIRCDGDLFPKLIDFGLAADLATANQGAGATGTLGFIPPEGLVGEFLPSSDLFSLGATLYHAWTGIAPFGTGKDSVRTLLAGDPVPPSALQPGFPKEWDELILQLLSSHSEIRPSNGSALLHVLNRLAPDGQSDPVDLLSSPGNEGDPFHGVFVGRDREFGKIQSVLDSFLENENSVSAIVVSGPFGVGRKCLVEKAITWLRLQSMMTARAVVVEERDMVGLKAAAGIRSAPANASVDEIGAARASTQAQLLAWLEERSRQTPVCVSLNDSDEARALIGAVCHGEAPGRLLFLVKADSPHLDERVLTVELQPWGETEVAQLFQQACGGQLPEGMAERIARASGGIPIAVVLMLREWLRSGRIQSFDTSGAGESGSLGTVLETSFRALSRPCRVAITLSLMGYSSTNSPGTERVPVAPDWLESRQRGWLQSAGDSIVSEAHRASAWRCIKDDPYLMEVVRNRPYAPSLSDARTAEILLALGRSKEAAEKFWSAMESEWDSGSLDTAGAMGRQAWELSGAEASFQRKFSLARIYIFLGKYSDGLEVLPESSAGLAADECVKLAETRAWICSRKGALDLAQNVLVEALASLDPRGEGAQVLRVRLSRVLISAGKFHEVGPLLDGTDSSDVSPSTLRGVLESKALSSLYMGNHQLAWEHIAKIDELRTIGKWTGGEGRSEGLKALWFRSQGKPASAIDFFERSILGYGTDGDIHGAAVARFNLGCVCAECGEFGRALTSFASAMKDLARLGAWGDWAIALFNSGQLFLELLDIMAADRCAARLGTEIDAHALNSFQAQFDFLKAGVCKGQGDLGKAKASFDAAALGFSAHGLADMSRLATVESARVDVLLGNFAEAEACASGLEKSGQTGADDVSAVEQQGSVALLRGHLYLASQGRYGGGDLNLLVGRLSKWTRVAHGNSRLPLALDLCGVWAALCETRGDAAARESKALFGTLLNEIRSKTPTEYWKSLEMRFDMALYGERTLDSRVMDVSWVERISRAELRLKKLLKINKRINSEHRLSRLLELIIDTVIELVEAERGFLLLKDASGNLSVKVARNIDQVSLEKPGLSVSRSIANKVVEQCQSIFTIDAEGDDRFAEALSVGDLHLRSVLAVPLVVKGRPVGAIYVDHRLKKGAFNPEDLSLLEDFAEQGAIAIENARVVGELRRRENLVQSLNHKLEQEVARKEIALQKATEELRASTVEFVARYNYKNIIGRSPPMMELFRLLDRITDSSLPVMVEGESGTGKELVARALHFNGPRKTRPFVSENCAAVPETLLESILFGHQRGSFTGADRDSKGLFEIADGGTLFLDEVGEMSPGMQGKLLRVLQERELRRLGSEKNIKVDVRVVAATNRNLDELVRDGKFRQDLFYRLCVLRLRLPPLRDRWEDIPHLIAAFLEKVGAQKKVTISASAVEKLCSYSWPGNVRELENEIIRAATFAQDVIEVHDLSPSIAQGEAPHGTAQSDSLGVGTGTLKRRVEALEKQLIRDTLRSFSGNQTKTAKLLGLSRFGLQKKLRRYKIAVSQRS